MQRCARMKDMILCSPSPGTFATESMTFRTYVLWTFKRLPLDQIVELITRVQTSENRRQGTWTAFTEAQEQTIMSFHPGSVFNLARMKYWSACDSFSMNSVPGVMTLGSETSEISGGGTSFPWALNSLRVSSSSSACKWKHGRALNSLRISSSLSACKWKHGRTLLIASAAEM